MYFGRNLSLVFLVPCQEYSRMISTVKRDPTNACDVWGGWVSLHVFLGWVPGWISAAHPSASLFPSVWGGGIRRAEGGGISRVTQDTDTHTAVSPVVKLEGLDLLCFSVSVFFPLQCRKRYHGSAIKGYQEEEEEEEETETFVASVAVAIASLFSTENFLSLLCRLSGWKRTDGGRSCVERSLSFFSRAPPTNQTRTVKPGGGRRRGG